MSNVRRSLLGGGLLSRVGGGRANEPDIQLQDSHSPLNEQTRNRFEDRDKLLPAKHHYIKGHDDPQLTPCGKPGSKQWLERSDLMAVSLSLATLATAIVSVRHHYVAWRLSYNSQLQVIGVLLSIMSFCLSSVATRLFLLPELRFGRSTLGNIDGLLRNQALRERLDIIWRVALILMLVISPGLEIIPKARFLRNGSSSILLSRSTVFGMLQSQWPSKYIFDPNTGIGKYGMFGPAGVELLGGNTGLSLFTNATLPYLKASNFAPASAYYYLANDTTDSTLGTEPALPSWPHAYGFNILVVDNDRTAMLDTPNPDYVSAIQSSLSIGESWNLSVPVQATVATYAGPAASDSTFTDYCANAIAWQQDLNIDGSLQLAEPVPGLGVLYLGYRNTSIGTSFQIDCLATQDVAWRYNLTRQQCMGVWTITRGGSQLKDGWCDRIQPKWHAADVFHYSPVYYTKFYPDQLGESLAPFIKNRISSKWRQPSTNTIIAAMVWSRLTSLYSAANNRTAACNGNWDSVGNAIKLGVLYDTPKTILATRPTLRRSWALYGALSAQSILTVLVVIGIAALRDVPASKGFGLVSILAGIQRQSLDVLHGASLSGELSEDIHMSVEPIQGVAGDGTIVYALSKSSERHVNGSLMRGTIYS